MYCSISAKWMCPWSTNTLEKSSIGMPTGKMKEHSLQLWGQTFLSSQLGTMWSCVGLTGLGQRENWESPTLRFERDQGGMPKPTMGQPLPCRPGCVCSTAAATLLGCV